MGCLADIGALRRFVPRSSLGDRVRVAAGLAEGL